MASKASTSPRRTKHTASIHLITDKSVVVRWTREELEDRYLRLCDDHLQLKIQVNEKDETIKKQQAQLVKLRKGQGEHSVSPNREDNLSTMQTRLVELEKQNIFLKDKLKSANYQLKAYAEWPLSPYYLRSRPTTARSRPKTPQITPSLPEHPTTVTVVQPQPNVELIATLQEKILHIETNNFQLTEQNRIYELEINSLKDELKKKQSEFLNEYDKLKIQITTDQKFTVQENIEIIRLQKLLREKSNELALFQAKYNKMELDLRSLNATHSHVLTDLDQATLRIRTEQTLNSQLQNELRLFQSTNSGNLLQIKQELDALKRENEILNESNQKLTASVFNTEREKQWEITEKSLRSQIAQFETTIKTDVNVRGELLEKLALEISSKDDLEQQVRKLEITNLQQKAELERLQEKLNKVTVGQNIQYEELVEVISIIRQRKQATYIDGTIKVPDDLLPVAPAVPIPNFEEQLRQLELAYAETVQELEKTRNMLLIQHKINRDYQAEVEEVSKRAEQNKFDYERKLKEYAEMLDQRALRIQRLERQLHDIAYGTRPYRTVPGAESTVTELALEGGQTVLELHITKVLLTDQAVRYMQSTEPSTFLTIEFFDFEIQFTPMVRGAGPEMDFTCQYTVTVNDLFLHYLQTDSIYFELHQAIATNYKTWAAGHVDLKELLIKPQGKIQGAFHILGTSVESVGVMFGKVEFSAHLIVPVEQALRMYKERTKALGYILTEREERREIEIITEQQQNTNQLHIYIHRCHNLTGRIPGKTPSPYAVYQFFDFPDHDTSIVNDNSSPEFGDHMTYPIIMDRAADQFLRLQRLRIYVFDDSAPNDELSYIGHADVPLIPLVHNKPILGSFELHTVEDHISGTIDVSLNWQFAYVAAPDAMFIAEPLIALMPPNEKVEKPTKMSDELDETPVHLVQAKRKADGTIVHQSPVIPPPGPLPGPSVTMEEESESRTVVKIDRLIIPDVPKTEPIVPVPEKPPAPISIPREPDRIQQPIVDENEKKLSPKEPKDEKPLELPDEDRVVDEYNIRKTEEPEPKPSKLPPPVPTRKLRPISPPQKETASNGDKLPPAERPASEHVSDEDDVIVEPKKQPEGKVLTYCPPITIGVNSLWLPEESPLLTDENVSKVFVEWRFLDLQPEESETPEALPKPAIAGERLSSGVEMNPARRGLLKDMLAANESIIFQLVSDPGEQGDCEDLGTATISLSDIEKSGKDLENSMFDVMDWNDNTKIIAILHVSLNIVEAIRVVRKYD